jgi:hypothetical protein
MSFFSKIEAEFKSLTDKEPTFAQSVQSIVTYVAPVVLTVLTFTDPAIEPIVSKAISVVQSDLATVNAVVKSSTVTPGSTAAATVKAALGSITSNLSGLLQVAAVKNSAKITQITAAVNEISTEINSIPALAAA